MNLSVYLHFAFVMCAERPRLCWILGSGDVIRFLPSLLLIPFYPETDIPTTQKRLNIKNKVKCIIQESKEQVDV